MDHIPWLYDLQHFGIKLGLDNIRALLGLLDHPERAYRTAIVGGTNGKGSVAAMLHGMLEAHGVPAGMFTSPHLVRPHERIRVGRDDIDDAALQAVLGSLRARIDAAVAAGELDAHPSFFEVVTASALSAFRERGLRAGVLEVGLGGRLDATNAVEADLSVIVSVDLDHTKTLGATIGEIAFEKAGIVKRGRPVVHGIVRQRAIDVVRRTCRERGAELHDAFERVRLVRDDGDVVDLASPLGRYRDVRPSLPGRHQIGNARVAIAALELLAPSLELRPSPDAVRDGLASVRWAGRLQWIRDRPGRPPMLFDGAHNPSGMATLVRYLREHVERPPVALLGVMRGKLVEEMLEPLVPLVDRVVLTRPGVRRAAEPDEIRPLVGLPSGRVEVVENPAAALERACALCGGDGRALLVTGSLYLVGEVLGLLEAAGAPGPVSM